MKKKKKSTKPVSYTQIKDPARGFLLDLFTHGGHYLPAPEGMPNELVLLGMHYKIMYHSRIYNAKKKSQRLRGVVLYAHRLIYIDPMQTIHDMRETLYHEAGHVYLKVWQTKSEGLNKITYQQMEDICDLMGEAMPDLMANNK